MLISWKERLTASPDFSNIELWPKVDVNALNRKQRNVFIRNMRIVSLVIKEHKTLSDTAEICGVSTSLVSKLMNRVLGGDNKSDPHLTRALIPYQRLSPAHRTSPLPTAANPSGAQCAMSHLLCAVPQLKQTLDDAIRADLQDKPEAQNLTPKIFSKIYLDQLISSNWPQDKYPFTEPRLGYESIRCYFNKRKDELLYEHQQRNHPTCAVSHKSMTTLAFKEIQIDEQYYDLFCNAHIEFDGHLEPLKLSRVSLVLAIDVATNAVLSYSLALTAAPSQDDVLACLSSIFREWSPQSFSTPGLKYLPNSGFPSGKIENAKYLVPGIIRLDNAYCHMAHTIRQFVTKKLGATFNLGIPKTPKSRNWIEYAFNLANEYSHRPKSTAGSHVLDPKRQTSKNAKKPPIISLRTLEECLEIALTAHNARSVGHLANNSPLDLMAYQLKNFYLPILPKSKHDHVCDALYSSTPTVRWDKENRSAPHINIFGCRYQGKGLDVKWVGKKIRVDFNRNDIRYLQATSLNGLHLGMLSAPRSWLRFSHSLKTRKLIISLVNQSKLHTDDPLGCYFATLLKNRAQPSSALELVRVYREFKLGAGPEISPAINVQSDDNNIGFEDRHNDAEFPEWTPELSGIKREGSNG